MLLGGVRGCTNVFSLNTPSWFSRSGDPGTSMVWMVEIGETSISQRRCAASPLHNATERLSLVRSRRVQPPRRLSHSLSVTPFETHTTSLRRPLLQ
jgi:hypothetical protein